MPRHPWTPARVDELIQSVDLPVRDETLADAWNRIGPPTGAPALPAGQVLLLVVMRVRPGRELRFEAAAREFVDATLTLPGAVDSTLLRSVDQPVTWFLVERFRDQPAFETHMASDYFRAFQVEQETLLEGPVQALFLQRA